MSTDAVPPSTLASLVASRARQRAVTRWLRPLAPCVMAVVVWASFHTRPAPGTGGAGLAVSVAVGGFALGGLGVLTTLRGPSGPRLTAVALLLAASVALVWLQPDGVGIAGVFVVLSLLAPRSPTHLAVSLTAVVLALVGTAMAIGGQEPLVPALLNVITLGAFYGMLFLAVRLGEANRLAERLLTQLERSRAAEARAAGLAERTRLAREMHDVLAHSLSGLMLQLEGARMMAARNPADPRLAETVERAHHLGKSGLTEARRAIGTLRDDELPGPERLAGVAQQFQRDRGVPCHLRVVGAPYEVRSEVRLALYRVAQEALTNVGKHARPAEVELCLCYEPSVIRLAVEDRADGDVRRSAPASGDGGYGLTGMRERAELLGGSLTAGPTAHGFRVELEVPA